MTGKVIPLFPTTPGGGVEAITHAGERANCKRCGVLLKVATARNAKPDPRAIRLAKAPVGHCAACAFTEWFFVMQLRETHRDLKPGSFLAAPVQAQLAVVMKSLGCDITVGEIDWAAVARNWNLPFELDGRKIDPNKGCPHLGKPRRRR